MKRRKGQTTRIRATMLLLIASAIGGVPFAARAGDGHEHDHADEAPAAHADEHVTLSPAEITEFGLELAVAGPDTVRLVRKLPAEVKVNANRLAHIAPRYAGIATEVRGEVGDAVKEGQVLAIVESDESLAPYEMTAYLAGTIIKRHMTRGEPVSRERDGFVVADLSTVWIDIMVYQRDLDQVTVGKDVAIRARAGGGAVDGKISYVTPLVDEHTRTATARLEIDNRQGRWRPGMFVMADVLIAADVAPVVVPATALHAIGEQDIIFVQTDNGFEPRPVRIGREGARRLEIIAGLAPGETYVAVGGFTLKAELGKESFGDGHAH